MELRPARLTVRLVAGCSMSLLGGVAAALEPDPVAPPQILPIAAESCGHFSPSAAFGPDGRLLAAWEPLDHALHGRFLAASGTAVGPELELVPPLAGAPALIAAPGGWVAAWPRGTPGFELVLQRLGGDGSPAGPVVRVATGQLFHYPPALAVAADGTLVVAWTEGGLDVGSTSRVRFRRFDAGGGALGEPVLVAELVPTQAQELFAHPAVALGSDGGFVVGWSHVQGGWMPQAAQVRGYAADGTPRGPARQLASAAFGPALTALPDGAYLASWAPRTDPTLWVQRLDGTAAALASPVLVQATSDAISQPALAPGPDWVAVAWVESASLDFPRGRLAQVALLDGHGGRLGASVPLHPPLPELFPDLDPFVASLRLTSDGQGTLAATWQVGNDVPILPSSCDVGRTVMAALLRVGEPELPPPPGNWSETTELPGFRFQVRITADTPHLGRLEVDCTAETACFSGARAGRSEVLLRVIGPRPNGRLWPAVVRFTPSQVEVWIEQRSSGAIRYYFLPAVPRAADELPGTIDRHGFPP